MKNIGKEIIYKDGKNNKAIIIAEDETHMLLKFKNGCKLCVAKNRYF